MKTYEKYNPSGVHWIGDIPAHWNIKKVKYSTSCNKSALSEKTDDDFELEYIDIGSVDGSGRVLSVENHRFIDAPSRARRIVNAGDTIISTVRTYLKAIAYIGSQKPNLICSTGFAVITPDRDLFDPKFLYFVCRSELFVDEICAVSKGVSYPAIDSGDIRNFYLWIPPIDEQTAIADYLDKETARIDELVGKKKRLIKLLKEERLAIINHAVTRGLDPNAKLKPSNIEWLGDIPEHWELRKISRSFGLISSGTTPTAGEPVYHSNGTVDWVNTGDLNDGILFECKKKVTAQALKDYPTLKIFPRGTLLIAMYGATIGKAAILDFEACTNQACCALAESDFFDINYVFYWFLSSKADIINLSYGGGQPNISQEVIKSLKVTCPPIEEQIQIVEYIKTKTQKIDATIAKIKKEIALLNEYRTALISEVVTGKIRVT